MRKFAMICPSRGRPSAAGELARAFEETSDPAGVQLVVVIDDDDPERAGYAEALAGGRAMLLQTIGRGARGMTRPLNAVATALCGPGGAELIGFVGDDHRPRTPGWAERFAETLSGGGPGFVYGNDLLMGERMPTAVAMTADVVRTLGYMAPPELYHLNVDVCWLEWGRALGRITYLPDVVIEHMHPAAGKAKLDDGYLAVNSRDMVEVDGAEWARYWHEGGFQRDVEKLRGLIG